LWHPQKVKPVYNEKLGFIAGPKIYPNKKAFVNNSAAGDTIDTLFEHIIIIADCRLRIFRILLSKSEIAIENLK
jgi:hypothetical protein